MSVALHVREKLDKITVDSLFLMSNIEEEWICLFSQLMEIAEYFLVKDTLSFID